MNSRIALAYPEWGLAAAAAVFLAYLILGILRRKKFLAFWRLSYSQSESWRNLLEGEKSTPRDPLGERILRVLRTTSLLLFALALARPQKVTVQELEPLAGVDIVLSIDTSASMQALDFEPLNRLQAAKQIAADFIAKRQGDRIGLVAFGGAAVLNCPLTLDHQAVQSFLKQVEIGMTHMDGTAIGSGLMTAVAHLRRVPSKSKLVLLLTDGRNNAGSVDPVAAAKTAQSLGIKVYTIGAGKRGGGIFAVQDPIFGTRYVRAPEEEIDEETLAKVSAITGGRYFRATEMGELKKIFEEIDRLEKTTVEPPRQILYEELYTYPVLIALALLALEMLMKATLLFALP